MEVWKYLLDGVVGRPHAISLPIGHRVLHAGIDPMGHTCVWCEVNPDQEVTNLRRFLILATGHPIPAGTWVYISTVIDRLFVWHIYVEE